MDPSSQAPAPLLRHSTRHRSASTQKGYEIENSQLWTAARCQRLLRQLQARLAALRKLKHQQLPRLSAQSKRNSRQHVGATSKRLRLTYSQKDRPSPPECAKTTPPRPRRAIGALRPEDSSPLSGPAHFRTPVWKKICLQSDTPADTSSQSLALLQDIPTEVPAHITEGMRSLRQFIPDAQHRLCEAVLEWLNGLLRSTASRFRRIQSRSLLAMCLRKVPACIASIELWDQQQSSDKRSNWGSSSVSLDIYDQLEGFGPHSAGWRPFKLLVRSQSLWLLSDAISEGLFHPLFISLLIRLCAHLDCDNEAATLACSVQRELPGPCTLKSTFGEREILQPLSSLLLSCAEGKASYSIYDCMATLIERQQLPHAWLCTRGLSCLWASGLENMASNNARPSVLRFMKAAVIQLSQCSLNLRKPDKCNPEQTLIGIAGGVTAAALTLESEMRAGRRSQGARAWRRLLYLLEYSIACNRQPCCRKDGHGNGLFILVLARCFAVMGSSLTETSYRQQVVVHFETMANNIVFGPRKDVSYRQMILLICATVQCRRRTNGFANRDNLREICSKLDELRLPDWYVKAVRRDTAFMLAQNTKDLRDLAFAESLPMVPDTLSISTMFSGWRWEEGISEWVLPDSEIGQTATSKVRVSRRQGFQLQSRKQGPRFKTTYESSLQARKIGQECSWSENYVALQTSLQEGQKGTRARKRVRPSPTILSQLRTAEDDRDDLF